MTEFLYRNSVYIILLVCNVSSLAIELVMNDTSESSVVKERCITFRTSNFLQMKNKTKGKKYPIDLHCRMDLYS